MEGGREEMGKGAKERKRNGIDLTHVHSRMGGMTRYGYPSMW